MTNKPDPGPSPDLSRYSSLPDDAYEWFLSDHPWAVAERHRRHTEYYERERQNATDVLAWTEKIDQLEPSSTSRDFDGAARRLAESLRPMANKTLERNEADSAVPAEVSIIEDRRRLEISRRVSGDVDDYTYPAHLIGPGAAAYPPPASGFPDEAGQAAGESES
jgi:hypothetical protein